VNDLDDAPASSLQPKRPEADGLNDMVAARCALLLKAIERHPEWDLVWWPL
jgi:hypothetical protein